MSSLIRPIELTRDIDDRNRHRLAHIERATALGEDPKNDFSTFEFTRARAAEDGTLNSRLDIVVSRVAVEANRLFPLRDVVASAAGKQEAGDVSFYERAFRRAREIGEAAQTDGVASIRMRVAGLAQPARVFVGPTSRILDYPIEAAGFDGLIRVLCERDDGKGRERLKALVENGPSVGGILFEKPQDEYEAVAGLLRWFAVAEDKKLRIRFEQSIREEIALSIEESGVARKEPMVGGVAAFCSQLLSAQGHRVTMYNEGHIISQFAGHLPGDMRVITDDETIGTFDELLARNAVSSPGHFSISINPKDRFSLTTFLGPMRLKVMNAKGQEVHLDVLEGTVVGERDQLVTGARFPVGFSERISHERLAKEAEQHDLVLLSGFQYPETKEHYDAYFRGVEALSSKLTPIVVEYSEARCKGTEEELYGILKLQDAPVTMISFNTSEATTLLKRLKYASESGVYAMQAAVGRLGLSAHFWADVDDVLARCYALSEGHIPAPQGAPWRNPQEDSVWVADAARLLQQVTHVPWVRVRGQYADVLFMQSGYGVSTEEAEQVRSALTFSRQQAALKSAIPAGTIRTADDEQILTSLPTGESLASNVRLGHELSQRYPSDISLVERLAFEGYVELPTSEMLFMAPPHEFRTRRNTVSAGDTMAATAAVGMASVLRRIHALRVSQASGRAKEAYAG